MAGMTGTNLRALPRGRLIAALVGGLLLLGFAGAALASRAPQTRDVPAPQAQDPPEVADQPPTAAELERVVERLGDAGVTTDVDTLAALAAEHGLGGAVRLVWWSAESGTAVDDLVDMRAGDADTPAMGWGQIAKELDVHPGLGTVMGGGAGHGREGAPGQNREDEPPAP
jgi:hypothetical protein